MVLILLYLLLAPFYLEVNSRENRYCIRYHKLAEAKIYATAESLFLELRIMGWHTIIDLLRRRNGKIKTVKKTKPGVVKISVRKMLAIVKSFKLSRCRVSADTGDMAMNGILYPWLFWLGRLTKNDVRINFCNDNAIELVIENNFYRLLRAYLTN